MKLLRILSAVVVCAVMADATLANITTTSLRIEGAGLKVITETVTTGIDLPATVQTEFGGKQNDQAPAIEGLVVLGDLTGPGLETPVQLATAPGHAFQIPGLAQAGTYYLQNIRLMNGTEFLQYATPAASVITVADLLKTEVTVRQLTPDELRARGIVVDARNYDVYEYSFTFIINGQEVKIEYPVIVDPRTHEVQPVGGEFPYVLPPPGLVQPPRWAPPAIIPMDFRDDGADLPFGTEPREPQSRAQGVSIPAAIVIPNGLAVLHQFFGVVVMVQNGAPDGSAAELHDVRATIRIPNALRTAQTDPQVSFGQPVPIVEPVTGVRFLVAQARGEAEWTLEGLQPGTHRIDFEIRATLKQPGQQDLPLRATPSAAVVVHDPRFNINFSHPDTVRKGIEYSTYAFVTNMSATEQSITISSGVEACDVNPSANVCRLNGETTDLLTIPAGEMRLVEYRLRSGVTGQVFATAGTIGSDNLTASVQLHQGVSESGIPLSPATLILPHYAQYVSPDVVSANLQLLGLGYSLATAPLNAMTAKFPRVIKTDVFQRAVDVARAGQRIFITNNAPAAKRDSVAHLALDLLGNGGYELRQWDELRRREKSGRLAGASIARELEATGLGNGATMPSFFDDFASATAHRQGFVAALAHGTASGERPYAISFVGKTTGRRTDVPNEAEAGWVRNLPYSDISRFNGAGESGELGLVARWTEDLDVVVTPLVDGPFALELLYPDSSDGSHKRAHFDVSGMQGRPVTISLTRGATSLNAMGDAGIAAVGTVTTAHPAPLAILGARQDLHLDEDGHKVSVLFNRPVQVPEGVDLRTKFTGAIAFNRDSVVYDGPRPISAAALQEDGRTVHLTFDHSLSQNATYTIDTGSLVDPITSQSVSFTQTVPKIDNDLPGGVIYGKVLKGDDTPVSGADVVLRQYEPNIVSVEPTGAPQYDVSQSDGAFLFEWVRRQTDLGWQGSYRLEAISTVHKTTSVEGSVRLPGKVHFVNLQYLGRGSAEGYVRYENGEVVAGVYVVVGSTMFNQFRQVKTDANGFYRVEDLPVGPLTFSAKDEDGNVTYAAAEVSMPGEVVTQNLSIFRQPFPGLGRVHGTVRRSDTNEPMAGVHVGVYSQGYGLIDGHTDSAGRFSFDDVPAGLVTVLAEEWSIARQSVASDFDLQANEIREVNLVFLMQPAMQTTTLTGQVFRENPLQPGVQEVVPGALVKISGYRLVTADAEGRFTYENIPLPLSGKKITAYDPQTKRTRDAFVPTLSEAGPNHVAIFINAFDRGKGTIRVRLLNAAGSPVSGYRVIVPGFPPDVLSDVGNGVYELHDVPVGTSYNIRAVPVGFRPENGQPDPRPYGDQMASGDVMVAFNGQIAPLTLRLPGQGTVRVRVRSQFDLITPVRLSYSVWDEGQQKSAPFTIEASTEKNGVADAAVFTRVPALTGGYSVASAHPQYGSASRRSTLAFDGDLQDHVLQLNTLATVSGTVYAIDGLTPVAGASVTISNGRSDPGPQLTGPDGRFSFPDQPSDVTVTVTAQVTQSGVYRIGEASARTPVNGGAIEELSVMLRKRGFVEGQVVYKDYKRFDPDTPANNIPDDTPGDYSDNAPVPLAKFHLRELDFPRRTFGTAAEPLVADVTGRFFFGNVFVGSLRATAWDPENEELRGNWSGVIEEEGQEATPRAYIAIGDGGAGALAVRVVDPNQNNAEVANADVSLFRSSAKFDFTTTGTTGVAEFTELPAGTYTVSAYSKSLGKSSASATVTIARDATASQQLALEFSGSVDGTLTDPEEGDAVVPGAHVRLTGSNYATQATTDVQGAFAFLGVREGAFTLDAKDTTTNRRATASNVILSSLDPHRTVHLELEPTETLHFAAYLPDDFGNRSDVLGTPMRVQVQQRGSDYLREQYGNPVQFEGALKNAPYVVSAWVPGDGERPSIKLLGAFPKGSAADPLVYVFPAFGEVRVTVMQGGAPAAGARVSVYGTGTTTTVYTDDSGLAVARGVGLGNVHIQAESLDRRFTGNATAALTRQSVPATAAITLGTYAALTGYVEAEEGGPSIGTRVIASYGAHVGEIRTDPNGRYTFLGIPAPATGSLRVHLTFVGPDDETIGWKSFKDILAGETLVEAAPVKLDATAPLIVGLLPEDGAVDVSPDASITIRFSDRLDTTTLTAGNLQLVAADGSGAVTCTITYNELPDRQSAVVLKPNAPATGLPLKSNTLYRVIVTQNVKNASGHNLPAPRAFAFTTSDYAEPRVVKVLPASPIPAATTFEFRFNEPIDPAPWQPGGTGIFAVYELRAPGGADAQVDSVVPARAFLDPATNMTLFIAPEDGHPIQPDSFYRVQFEGVRDPQGNVLGPQTYHFSSFDEIPPHVVIVAPAAGVQLVSGSEYEIKVELRNGSPTGSIATDVTKVEYFTVAADGTERPFATVTKAPFSVKIIGPEAPVSGATFTIGAQAYDSSGWQGPKTTASWTVKPNVAPANVVVTPLQTSAYPSAQIGGTVAFQDEGSFVTVTMKFEVPRTNAPVQTTNITKSFTRLANGSWPEARFTHTLPSDAQPGANATLTATVTDVRGLASAPASATVAIDADTIAPTIVSVTPAAGTTYANRDRFVVEAIVSDAQTGVQSVTFFVDGKSYAVASSGAGPTPGTQKFRSVEIEARSKAEDVNIPIVVTAKDFGGNSTSSTHDVVYAAVDDPNAPKVTWLCPVDGAGIPALYNNYSLDLRVSVVDEDVQSVKFLVGDDATPLEATLNGATEYRATYAFPQTPAAGPLEITVVVDDTVASHRVELPIALDVVNVDVVVTQPTAVVAADAASYAGKSVAVIGSSAQLVPHVPLSLENLLVLQGGTVTTLATGITREFRLDVTAAGITYVDCASSIDVTGKGYPGGFAGTLDGPNDDPRGFTVGNTPVGGADGGIGTSRDTASASHAGRGGVQGSGASNDVYGSITQPVDLGSGGGGYVEGTVRYGGGSGGGAIRLRAGSGEDDAARVVIAGRVLADGVTGASSGSGGSSRAGAGGSVWIDAKRVVVGAGARVSANGADDRFLNQSSSGGGGGRIALAASLQLDVHTPALEARGGRHETGGSEPRYAVGGGAGTIHLRRPGQTGGELLVSSYDARFPNSVQLTMPVPLGRIGGGTSTSIAANALTDTARTFDRWMIGEKLTLAGDTSRAFTVTAVSADGHTLHTDPAEGSLLDVATSQTVEYAGLLAFDKVTAGPRALLVFDDRVDVAGAVDETTAMAIDPAATVVLRGDRPSVTTSSTPAAGASLIRDTTLSFTYDAASPAGVKSVAVTWSLDGESRVQTFTDLPLAVSRTLSLPVPATAPLGTATLAVSVTDRADRTLQLPAQAYTVVDNAAPAIASFTIAPSLSIHAGHDVVATLTATDDVAVKSIAFEAKLNGAVVKTQSFAMSAPEATRQFTVPIANDVAGGSVLTIDAAAGDAFPGRAATSDSKTITILTDANAPQLTIVSPAAGATYPESSGVISIRVTAVDAEVAVKEAFAQLDGGAQIALTRVGSTNDWTGEIAAPPVDGSSDVPRTVIVTARDYAGNAATANVAITIQAITDPSAPTLKWLCASGPDVMFPAGSSVKLRVSATANTTAGGSPNPVQAVEMVLSDATPLAVTSLGGDRYEATLAIPSDAAEGTVYSVRAIARSAGGASSDLVTSFTIVVPTIAPIAANTTIDSSTTIYDHQTVVVQSGTVTIRGTHTFDRLIVLGGSVVAPNLETLHITTTRGLYVACDASVSMTGRGYSSNTTYPGHALPTNNTGGSHIGYGGEWSGTRGATFGSVYRPAENGGSGPGGSLGGGIVHIDAASVVVDGTIAANGSTSNVSGGGGGSIWIRTQSIAGAGSIEANGGTSKNGYGSGGGGAIAIEYDDADSVLPVTSSLSGTAGVIGAPGSIYVKGPNATYGDLRIDHGGLAGQQTKLPSLGNGSVTGISGATITTDRTSLPQYFGGHWIEVRDAAQTLKGTWRIASAVGNSLTLEGDAGAIAVGDAWQGVYRFDDVVLRGARLEDTDPIRVAATQRIESAVELSAVSARDLHVIQGASLAHLAGSALSIAVTGELRVDAGAAIDVTGRGYANATYPGESLPTNNSGGSHIGHGGQWNGGAKGSAFGSVYEPGELGGAGPGGSLGGGIVRIDAASVVVDGTIAANGSTNNVSGGGGGSISIRTQSIAGNGSIEANGGASKNGYGSGGGGAIALRYTDASSVPPAMKALSGNAGERGGAGSIYTRGPGSTYGTATIDNTGITTTQTTALPSLGRGSVVSVAGARLVTDRASIQPFFAGHWLDVFAPGGALKGTWRIASVDGGSLTLEGTHDIAAGDTWRGVYLFDAIELRNAKVVLLDDLRAARDLDGTSTITINDPPVVDPAKLALVAVSSAADGDFVVGPAGTITDPHTPVVVTAQNTRTNQTFSANALVDGSFRVEVTGEVGDTFTFSATDSFSLPARTATFAVSGAIASANSIASLGLLPSTVTGGGRATATLRLAVPVRRASDGVVTLTSSSESASVPATVTVPLGSSSVSFPVTTTAVAATTAATITASTGFGSSQSATLTIVAGTAALTQLTLDPSTVIGGAAINATLVLGAPAPEGGALVSLASSNTRAASVPPVVLVPEGATSEVFTVTTYPVAANETVTLTATYGAAVSAAATIEKCAQLTETIAPPASTSLGTTWIDDSLPAGATQTGEGTIDSTQFASGSLAIHLSGASPGVRTLAFTGGAALSVAPTDKLVVHALVNPCDPPRQILVGWKSATAEYRASWGESRIEPTTAHRIAGAVPRGAEWVRLEVLAKSIGITSTASITGLSVRAMDGEAWFDAIGTSACAIGTAAAPELNPNEDVWFDDDVPAGAVLSTNTATSTTWTWDPTQAATGTRSHVALNRTGLNQHYFTGAAPLVGAPGDVLYAYVLLDPCNPPRQVMLQWNLNNGADPNHRAYWGDDLVATGQAHGSAGEFRVGPLPELGKWVRLEVPAAFVGLEGKEITGATFTIFDGQAWFDRSGRIARVDVAAGKPATQSSTFSDGTADRAVDGDFATINHTNSQAQAWWEVDLGASMPIETIWLYNRNDSAAIRIQNFWVLVSDEPMPATLAAARAQAGVSAMRHNGFPADNVGFTVNRTGRYVRVQLEGTNFLHMRELQVWASASGSRRNLALGTSASQSTTPNAANGAVQVVDGLVNSNFNQTSSQAESWWQTDLGSVQEISTITVFNRGDANVTRLANFYVFVSPDAFTANGVSAILGQAGVKAYYYPSIPLAGEVPVHARGRYVRVQLTGTNILHLNELHVWSQQQALAPMGRSRVSPPER